MVLKQTEITKALNDFYFAKELLDKGVNPNDIKKDLLNDILLASIMKNSTFGIKTIFEYNFDMKLGGFCYEIYAIQECNENNFLTVLKNAKKQGVDLKRTNPLDSDTNVLIEAVRLGSSEKVILEIIKCGLNWNDFNAEHGSALHYLFKNHQQYSEDFFKQLMENNPDFFLKDKNDITPADIWLSYRNNNPVTQRDENISKIIGL